MFRQLPNSPSFPKLEGEVLEYWRDHQIYETSLEQRAGGPKFVFYEGPPTANGMPHPGHCLTRAIKDLFPRYKTMRGYECRRKAGWDTHGLPVEVEVCKDLGIHSKEEIEQFGIEPFIHKCQASVWRYMQEWEKLTERLGFWIHLDEAYVTYHQSYVESVWWSLKTLFDKGLLYQGHKIVWWWAQGGTALSSGEVGQGYKNVADPSVFVRFPLVDEPDVSLLVWTTTPWTLPSNQFAAVNPNLEYVQISDSKGTRLILAKGLYEAVAGKAKETFEVEKELQGTDLVGLRYVPPFDYYHKDHADAVGELKDGGSQKLYWRVVAADFVTTDSGSGVVHQAPAFGEVDYEVLLAEQERFTSDAVPELICAVGPDGRFTSEAPDFEGQWVKDADKPISRELKQRGLMYHQEQYLHDYPFCWRADDDPLIQYPRKSWFIRTTEFKDSMLANNRQINWLPDHIQDGRFGNFLESNVDWALSRERYWGTPLPIWVCEETQQMEAIGSYDELVNKPGASGMDVWEKAKSENPDLCDDLKVHKPYIDEVTYDSPFAEGARMRRVTEVIDCWYDSGAMPFAQWGFPHSGEAEFDDQFPADFISEALDQTRGWFYSQLAISTMLFGDKGVATNLESSDYPHPFRNCIVLGLMLGEDGRKMSKRDRNYREPDEIFDRYGADALRWYFFANQAPWTPIRYKEQAIKDSIPEFLLRLWNVFAGFFCQYANLDGFAPEERLDGDVGQLDQATLLNGRGNRPVAERPEIDRWVVGELNRTLREVVARMDQYDNYAACQAIHGFVDALSNWYVRRSRDRFWSQDKSDANQDKLDAYWTLFECLTATARMVAPFTPFLAETMWQTLAEPFGDRVVKSVHLCDYPQADESLIDEMLSERMSLLREIASRGRRARTDAKLKVRQPLQKVEVILGSMADHQEWLESHDELLRNELNVKEVHYPTDASQYIRWEIRPNFKLLGPKLGKQLPVIQKTLAKADVVALVKELDSTGQLTVDLGDSSVVLEESDIERRLQANEGWSAVGRERSGSDTVVVISTELTPELNREGQARDVVRFVQDRRKQLDLQRDARIEIGLVTESDELRLAIEENYDYIQQETLAESISFAAVEDCESVEHQIDDETTIVIYVNANSDSRAGA